MDENKDKIRGVLKGRLPSEKDLKKEIANTFGLVLKTLSFLLFGFTHVLGNCST